ncbi:hypothetical protein GCM10011574_45310 [Microbispora bryophytorum]|uniref:Uncharacterized protein n=1 Tax=Microbispora bryophytorum TaxID=1460882 RepID=A0A8H9H2D9_9ACTN|nr:hypothetical protein GCM10011574_45310 [Microbispora bryophytorum]
MRATLPLGREGPSREDLFPATRATGATGATGATCATRATCAAGPDDGAGRDGHRMSRAERPTGVLGTGRAMTNAGVLAGFA